MTSPSLLEAAKEWLRVNAEALNTEGAGIAPESLAAWASSMVEAERERCIAECERIREAERNVGEDCPSGGWGGYKLGARDCASAIRNLRHPPAGGEGA